MKRATPVSTTASTVAAAAAISAGTPRPAASNFQERATQMLHEACRTLLLRYTNKRTLSKPTPGAASRKHEFHAGSLTRSSPVTAGALADAYSVAVNTVTRLRDIDLAKSVMSSGRVFATTCRLLLGREGNEYESKSCVILKDMHTHDIATHNASKSKYYAQQGVMRNVSSHPSFSIFTAIAALIAVITIVAGGADAALRVGEVPISIGMDEMVADMPTVVPGEVPSIMAKSRVDGAMSREGTDDHTDEEYSLPSDFPGNLNQMLNLASTIAFITVITSATGIAVAFVYLKMLTKKEDSHKRIRRRGRLIPDESMSALPRSAFIKRNKRK